MEKILIILNSLIRIISVIPLWNFEASTINLLPNGLNSYSYIIYKEIACGKNIELNKQISKAENGTITEKNYFSIDGIQIETNWEDIESRYCLNDIIYICPKGKNHLNKYNSNSFSQIIPNDFSSNDDWELKCYEQPDFHIMFIGYLNKNRYFYAYKYNVNSDNEEEKWGQKTEFNEGLFDFKWQTTKKSDTNYYPMICIALNGEIQLQGKEYYIEENSINNNNQATCKLIDKLTYSNAYFIDGDTYKFYFITYDKNPPNFKSGYHLGDGISFDYINYF